MIPCLIAESKKVKKSEPDDFRFFHEVENMISFKNTGVAGKGREL